MSAYYNEIDRYCCDWLQNLMDAGHIMAGKIDDRSIADISPDDVAGYERVHFFAGIGGWEYALRLAEWPRGRPVWTGSCPCQPFSAAGKQRGTDDKRHLWPEFRRLIEKRRPSTIFGEQVASPLGRQWFSGVRSDLEKLGYATGGGDLCAAGVGAPHIRQRLWFVADADGRFTCDGELQRSGEYGQQPQDGSVGVFLGNAESERLSGRTCKGEADEGWRRSSGQPGEASGVANTADTDGRARKCRTETGVRAHGERGLVSSSRRFDGNGFWNAYDALPCTDGKARRIEPGTFPLAHGIPARTSKLRGYGNAINPQTGAEFIAAFLECGMSP